MVNLPSRISHEIRYAPDALREEVARGGGSRETSGWGDGALVSAGMGTTGFQKPAEASAPMSAPPNLSRDSLPLETLT